jgi:antirestriction protein ArdC
MQKQSVYDIITEDILEIMNRGIIPWRRPWAARGAHRNLVSGKSYRGVNVFLLSCAGFSSPWWLTFQQAKQKGGMVRKGEKGRRVIFWKWLVKSETDQDTGEKKEKKIPLLKYYVVFNLEQIEDINAPEEPEAKELHPIEDAARIVEAMPSPPGFTLGVKAAYNPALDKVMMPEFQDFNSAEEYYSTLFHEMGHSTGHVSRLNRPEVTGMNFFGSHEYSKEELVAEMTAAFLCGVTGILPATIKNSAAYLQSWAKVFDEDRKMVICGAAAAQKAADFILGVQEAGA